MFLCSYYSDRGQCAKCYLSCKTCSGPRRDQCVSCPTAWQLASGECHPECPEGDFKSEFGCRKCHHYCRTCKGLCNIKPCFSSFLTTTLIGKVTLSSLQWNLLLIFPGEGPLECTSCPPRSMLEGGLCMECLGGQYYDSQTQLCKTCHESCRTCTGPGKYNCASCAKPLHLHKLNNQCVLCCAANEKKAENDECCLCDPDTG